MVLTTMRRRRRLRPMEATPATEARGVTGAELDLLSTPELVLLMNREDALVPLAVGAAGQAVAEDDETAGRRAIEALSLLAGDAVVAVSASGGTPFTLGAARAAAEAGAFTACVVCAPHSQLASICEREIMVLVGPEILAGSTRL